VSATPDEIAAWQAPLYNRDENAGQVTDLDTRVTRLEQATLPSRVTSLEGRVTSVEGRVTTLEGKLAATVIDLGPISMSAGGQDFNVHSVTPTVNGWVEVTLGVIYYGFSGTNITTFSTILFCNQITAPDGGALQTPASGGGGLPGATWGRVAPPPPLIFPVVAGAGTYVTTFRAGYTVTTTNCYVRVYGTGKLYAN